MAGRPSVRPSVAANSRLVTGAGAVALIGPLSESCHEGMMHRTDGIIHRDPADPLPARPDPPAGTQPKRRQHPLEGPARGRQNDAEAGQHDADPRGTRRFGRRFPSSPELDEEVRPSFRDGAGLGEDLVPPIAIGTDGRGTDQHLGRSSEPGEGLRQKPGALHPAFGNPALPGLGPPRSHVLPRQMHHRVQPLQSLRIQPALRRIPGDLGWRVGFHGTICVT